jgi:hypothetical protein
MGRRVAVSVEEDEVEHEDGGMIPGVIVTCEECGESVEVYGTSDASIRRGCIMLKEQCGSDNWYTYSGDD